MDSDSRFGGFGLDATGVPLEMTSTQLESRFQVMILTQRLLDSDRLDSFNCWTRHNYELNPEVVGV